MPTCLFNIPPVFRRAAFVAVSLLALTAAQAQPKGEIRIAHVYSKTGPLEAYGKQTQIGFKADLGVDPSSSGVALALLPVAEEYKKLLLVEPAVADSITGDKWNRYIFRTGRNSSQDAISNAVAQDKDSVPAATTDFTAGAQRIIDRLKDAPGRKVIWVIWAGAGNPFKIADLDLKRYGIEIATGGGNILPAMSVFVLSVYHFPSGVVGRLRALGRRD